MDDSEPDPQATMRWSRADFEKATGKREARPEADDDPQATVRFRPEWAAPEEGGSSQR